MAKNSHRILKIKMTEIIRLETLDLEVPHNGGFEFHDEGYMDLFDLYNLCTKIRTGKEMTYREIMNTSFEGIGASESFDQTINGKALRRIHICRIPSLRGLYPLDGFVHAHEETAVLAPWNTKREDLLIEKLKSLGLTCRDLSGLKTPHEIENVGGISYLASQGIEIGNEQNPLWKKLMEDWIKVSRELYPNQRIKVDPEFLSAVEWFLERK